MGGGLGHLIVPNACGRFDRLAARRHPVHHGTQGVQIRPGALVTFAVVLLKGRKPGAHNIGHILAPRYTPRSPKIQQNGRAVGTHIDIVWLDVAVQKIQLVDGFQTIQQGIHNLQQALLCQPRLLIQPVFKWVARLILHHDIGTASGDALVVDFGDMTAFQAQYDLALLLAEAMQNIQQQMAGGMPGNQSCQKPGDKGDGKGRKPSNKMSKGQGEMGESLEQMRDRMKKGAIPSKEFAKMAAKQAAMRNALRELQKGKQEQGKADDKQ